MSHAFVLFWVALIVASIAWYGFLVFYIGIKAGREITTLTKDLVNVSAQRRGSSPTDRPAR